MKKQVYAIVNEQGRFYTGAMRMGRPVFSTNEEDALEMDSDELRDEMQHMPEGVTSIVLYEYDSKN